MPKEIEITCDRCGKDLTTTGATPKFRLILKNETIPQTNRIVHVVIVRPIIIRDRYFCDLSCLRSWPVMIAMTVAKAPEQFERLAKAAARLGQVMHIALKRA